MSPISRVERLLAQGNVRGLCRMLRHRNSLVRRRAAQVLGELGRLAGVPCLVRALHTDSDQYVLRWSIDSLRTIGDETAIDALVAAMFGAGQQIPRLAAQALAEMTAPQAAAALELREILLRNDWEALAAIGDEAKRSLAIVFRSEQYANWPSGKRRQILISAVRLGVTPSLRQSGELAELGLFVSGVHTMGDLLRGLRHRSPEIRIAAAEKLGMSDQAWTAGALYRQFRREARLEGERSVAIACARALSQLGDGRATAYYRERLRRAEGRLATDAARALAEIRTKDALEALFWFVAEPPPPPGYRNVPLVLSALESAGPAAADALETLLDHEEAKVRRLMVDVFVRSKHPQAAALLGRMAQEETDPDVQHAALDALAMLNTGDAVEKLHALDGQVPNGWVTRALAATTHPAGPRTLRKLVPDATILYGTVKDEGKPLAKAHVQVVREHYRDEDAVWEWRAISGRAETDEAGAFALSVFRLDDRVTARLKVVVPLRHDGTGGETFMADLPLVRGRENHTQVQIDRFFSRLVVTVSAAEAE